MESPDGKGWTFLTNHARVLITIARDPEIRIRDISGGIDITERAAQLIINDLVDAGYLTRHRVGRRNTYTVAAGRPFRHPTEADQRVDALITLFAGHDEARPADRPTGPGPGTDATAPQTPAHFPEQADPRGR